MRIETQRLVLRPLLESDAGVMKQLINSDREISENTIFPPNQSTNKFVGFIQNIQRRMVEETDFVFAILYDHELIGSCGLYGLNNEFSGLGFWIGKEFRSKGFATEAVDAIVELAKEKGIKTIRTNVYEWNVCSMRVLEKSGFRKIGEGKHIRKWDNNEFVDFHYELDL
ncbi:MAG: GNAT family N-acetyltransferase [Nanobdellota archaeon]